MRIKKFNPFSKQTLTEEVPRQNSIYLNSQLLGKDLTLSQVIIPSDSLKKGANEANGYEEIPGIKVEQLKAHLLNKDCAKLRKDFQDVLMFQRVNNENMKKNIDEIEAESAKPKPNNEKIAELQKRLKRQFAELKLKELRRDQSQIEIIKKTHEFLSFLKQVFK